MKQTVMSLLLFFYLTTNAQNYTYLVAKADSLYKIKEYKPSVKYYKSAFKFEQKNALDLYNGACSAALLGNKKQALKWLNLSMQNGWTNVTHLSTDSDLISLHNCKKWKVLLADMQLIVDKIEANYDKPLQENLITIFNDDQTIRRQFIAAQKEFGHNSKQVDSLGMIMMFKDSINLIKITDILDRYGWVGVDKVGGQANQTLFLVIQHADLKTQQKYLPLMREAVQKKNANSSSLALLEDRVALGEGRKQIYGSQIGYDNETEKNYVLPLDDPDNVDKRRAEVGLGKIADYVKNWGIIWDVEVYKLELRLLEEKEEK